MYVGCALVTTGYAELRFRECKDRLDRPSLILTASSNSEKLQT